MVEKALDHHKSKAKLIGKVFHNQIVVVPTRSGSLKLKEVSIVTKVALNVEKDDNWWCFSLVGAFWCPISVIINKGMKKYIMYMEFKNSTSKIKLNIHLINKLLP